MRVQEWFSSYTNWVKIARDRRKEFDYRKRTMMQIDGPRFLCNVDGIDLQTALVEGGSRGMDLLEARIRLNKDSQEIVWDDAVSGIILLSASLEFPGEINMDNLHIAGEISKKVCVNRHLLQYLYPRPICVHSGRQFDYWLESEKDVDGNVHTYFTGKQKEPGGAGEDVSGVITSNDTSNMEMSARKTEGK